MSEAIPKTLADSTPELDREIEEAEAEVKRCERAVLDAATREEADAARDDLTRAELALDALLDERSDCGSCEGWPKGK